MCREFISAAIIPFLSVLIYFLSIAAGSFLANEPQRLSDVLARQGTKEPLRREVVRTITNYGEAIGMLNAFMATIVGAVCAPLALKPSDAGSTLYVVVLIVFPLVLVTFFIFALATVGLGGMFTHRVRIIFGSRFGRPALPVTYGWLINAAAVLVNVIIIVSVAHALGVTACRSAANKELGGSAAHAMAANATS